MNENTLPWYRQFWPWFIIAFPLSAVLGGIATIFIAMHKPDGLVVDDYYREGLAINRTLEKQQYAREHAISANLVLNPHNGEIRLSLAGQAETWPSTLTLKLVHPTLANHDREVTLYPAPQQRFTGRLPEMRQGNWHVVLEPDTKQWQLSARVNLPENNNWQLMPD